MNIISRSPVEKLGYDFIPAQFIPKGKDEYYLRNARNPKGRTYRKLSLSEIKSLKANGNYSDNWNQVFVAPAFDPQLVQQCKFYGLVRIGKLDPLFSEYNNLRMPVGLYNSTIISCDLGDNVVIDHVNYLSHYIIGNDVMLVNINELAATDHAKFGNGILRQGEHESVRIRMELCNENGGRSVLPFDGMQPGDAWLWTRNRGDEKLMQQLKSFTEKKFNRRRGYYGEIGDRTVIKNCKIIKDVLIGSDAYLKGANKLKNLTINSSAEAKSQIGEGCELVNGIIGYGCRIFYGVKAVRFILSSNSQLKYGARLINSYLGDNSTISCCEVLNSLIFPGHEQHHNNSFLCAALVMGQSNMAAGATIGSNHNSRAADGEIIAGRGFWPGLCVSLKHNSKFASYTLIAKGDFPAELNIPLPFCLLSNDVSHDRLVIMPAYWFLYNMYALARNSGKYTSRDKRTDKTQHIEYDYLAPDTINEIFDALRLIRISVAGSWPRQKKKSGVQTNPETLGKQLLDKKAAGLDDIEITAEGFENSRRKVQLVKVPQAHAIYKKMITYYGITELIGLIENKRIRSWQQLLRALPQKPVRDEWKNAGGQLVPVSAINTLIRNIRSGKINSWDQVHAFYREKSIQYGMDKFKHAFASLLEVMDLTNRKFTKKIFISLLQEALNTREWMVKSIAETRSKDYESPYRQMLYESREEMERVIGRLNENSFLLAQKEELVLFRNTVTELITRFK